MAKFKDLLISILELDERGVSVADIATRLQVGRSVVEYALAMYGTVANN
jgi:orotate phosphoribosyltransferase-like protein